jgi:signal peptidase II
VSELAAGAIRRLGLGLALAVAVLDQASKWVIVDRVMDPPRFIEVTPFFNLVMVWNRGVSFGMFNSGSPYVAWGLSAVALSIVLGLLVWLYRVRNRLVAVAIGLIVGGAVGNVIDRIVRDQRAVADFLDFHAYGYHWPAFNLADSAITLGVVVLLYDALFNGPESRT